jgi:RHS repeat-associated protein
MPIEFTQYTQPTGSSGDTLFKLLMKYDGSGRRISKTSMRKSVNSDVWDTAQVTHYTGSTKETKVVVNMPQGLGRYGIEDAESPNYDGVSGDSLAGYIPNAKFEWYLKNHLGSTMLVYGTQSDANPQHVFVGTPLAAYDYRAFGEMVEMLPPTQKVTENFTGKEHDDEIALDYFGARYLDPMLGMWISVDPARQFASPYLYAGIGFNPISGQDDDGGYYNDENGTAIYETAKKNDFYGNPIVKETLEWGANSPNPINVTITQKDKFDKGSPAGGITTNSYSFVSKVLDVLNGCWKPSCSNAFAPDISSSDITIYNGSYDYMQRKGGYSRAGVPIDGMPLEEWQAKTLTHEIDFHIRDDLGQRKDSEDLEHRNKVKDAEMWK